MSFCRSKLYFETKQERRSQDSGLVQSLNFCESSDEWDELDSTDVSMLSANKSPRMWDPSLQSPTPVSSPRIPRRSPRNIFKSPIPFNCDDSDEDHDSGTGTSDTPPTPRSLTPPHKRLKSLKLYDTPHTPKSLIQKAQRRFARINKIRPETPKDDNLKGPTANINPFTPNNNTIQIGQKRSRPATDFYRNLLDDSAMEDTDDDLPSSKKIALHDINTSRYNEEFVEVEKLGDGEFGSVYKCINRLDGCPYAIKKSKTPIAGSVYERTAMNEVYAHAVLGKHQHVVRYYSAWAEKDHMFIQNEYCNGGCLQDVLSEYQKQGRSYSEAEVKQVFLQLVKGLQYIHSQNLVHLDIKPGNIFLHRNHKINNPESGLEEDFCEDSNDVLIQSPVIYKIGDLGHVTSRTAISVEEGDCRYLPNEILREEYNHLAKADIFALGLTIFQVAGGPNLPKNGDDWHKIRKGQLPYLDRYSEELNKILLSMIDPDPKKRPSAALLAKNSFIQPNRKKSSDQLIRELNEEKFKNEILSRQLQEATSTKKPDDSLGPLPKFGESNSNGRSSRLIGRKVNRSMSLTCF